MIRFLLAFVGVLMLVASADARNFGNSNFVVRGNHFNNNAFFSRGYNNSVFFSRGYGCNFAPTAFYGQSYGFAPTYFAPTVVVQSYVPTVQVQSYAVQSYVPTVQSFYPTADCGCGAPVSSSAFYPSGRFVTRGRVCY